MDHEKQEDSQSCNAMKQPGPHPGLTSVHNNLNSGGGEEPEEGLRQNKIDQGSHVFSGLAALALAFWITLMDILTTKKGESLTLKGVSTSGW